MKNYLNELCYDLKELIYFKLHKMYMEELKEEIYEESLEFEWRRVVDSDSDYEMSEEDSDDYNSSFSYVDSDSE